MLARLIDIRSFGAKITLLVTLTSGLAVVLVSGLLVGIHHLDLRRETMEFVNAQVNSVAINCEAPIDFDDPRSAREILASLRAVPEVVRAVLYKHDVPFAVYDRAGINQSELTNLSSLGDPAPEWMVFSSPVGNLESASGRVEILFDTRGLTERLQSNIMLALAVAALAMVVAFMIATRIRRVLGRPVAELADTALRVSQSRDFSIRAEKYSDDELGQLTTNFNEMMDQIQRQDAEIQAANAQREGVLGRERAARAEAEHLSRLKDEFVATLSHELRTPLTAILGWAQMMRRPGFDLGETAQGLEVIERNARAQTQIIEDLLDMSRIISGKIRLDVQRINLADVIEAAIHTVQASADAKRIELHAPLDRNAGVMRGDPSRLQQVFWNLVSNAIKFTNRGGCVTVMMVGTDNHVEINVTDNGQGIQPEFLPFVFDRFRQADSSTTRRHGGLGLGLAIVKQLVELHGGRVSAHSLGEGSGSTFRVELPLANTLEDIESEVRSSPRRLDYEVDDATKSRLKDVVVLVVDDEPDARALISRILEECQAKVVVATSVEEAMQALCTHRPKVIVSDIGMPGEDGYALIRRLRGLEDPVLASTPALALTAFARSADRTRALLAGYQMHVAKPIEPSELLVSVASLATDRSTRTASRE